MSSCPNLVARLRLQGSDILILFPQGRVVLGHAEVVCQTAMLVHAYMNCLQHERPCCISIYKLELGARVIYLIQHGRECCKWLVKLSTFIDLFAKKF